MPRSERSTRATTDHEFIRHWADEREGQPSRVKGTGGKGDPGMIRIDFPGYSGEDSLEPISWNEFFDKFEEQHLALLYRDLEHEGGDLDRFNKLVRRESVRDEGD
jgi:hypothetical protein